jgi:crotonobetainyl-CoA:carnitine CoA-transferase CaiB-like acyl-CoA transferase
MAGYSLLTGIRVLEVAQLAPSSVGGHLADLGADVVKVESGIGDGVRTGGAAAVGTPTGPAFMHLRWNRGKRSTVLDLRSDAGKQAFLDLARECDVVIEGTRSGYLEWLGLGPDVLAEVKPSLVFCSISGFGSNGPYSRLGSGGPVFDGYAGLRKVELPEEPPTTGMAGSTNPSIAMYALGAYGAMGVLAAILDARRTGVGKRIEISGVDVAASWIPDEIDAALNQDRTVLRAGWLPDGRLPDWPRLEAYATSDGGAMLFGAHVEKFWTSFCEAVGREDLLAYDMITVDEGSLERSEHVWRELRKVFAERTRAEWTQLFLEHDIAGGPVHTVDELIRDPHFTARGGTYRLSTEHGELELMGSAVRVAGETFAPEQAPALGAHTDEVLGSLTTPVHRDRPSQERA